MRRLVFFAFTLLCACAAHSACIQYVDCPDGISDCQERAQELCPQGYSNREMSELDDNVQDFITHKYVVASAGAPHMIITCN